MSRRCAQRRSFATAARLALAAALACALRRRCARRPAASRANAEARGQGPALRRRPVPLLPGPLLHVDDDADGVAALRPRLAPRRRGRDPARRHAAVVRPAPEAGQIFAQLIERGAPTVRDRAWFYPREDPLPARLPRRGRERARARREQPARGLQEERLLLQANLLMARGDYAGAAACSRHAAQDAGARYARYNLGIALIKLAATRARGIAMLDDARPACPPRTRNSAACATAPTSRSASPRCRGRARGWRAAISSACG